MLASLVDPVLGQNHHDPSSDPFVEILAKALTSAEKKLVAQKEAKSREIKQQLDRISAVPPAGDGFHHRVTVGKELRKTLMTELRAAEDELLAARQERDEK